MSKPAYPIERHNMNELPIAYVCYLLQTAMRQNLRKGDHMEPRSVRLAKKSCREAKFRIWVHLALDAQALTNGEVVSLVQLVTSRAVFVPENGFNDADFLIPRHCR